MNTYDLIRKPVDYDTKKEIEKCRYALFPGYDICGAEPGIVIKLYDSLRFQIPDIAMFIYDYKGDADELRAHWTELGRPALIMLSPVLTKVINDDAPEIKTLSVYNMLIDLGISGGCNKESYNLYRTEGIDDTYYDVIKDLASDMGVNFPVNDSENDSEDNKKDDKTAVGKGSVASVKSCSDLSGGADSGSSSDTAVVSDSTKSIKNGTNTSTGDVSRNGSGDSNGSMQSKVSDTADGCRAELPYITCTIRDRDMLKSQGKEAAHILELIFGMGESNAHLIHEDEDEYEYEDDHEHEVHNNTKSPGNLQPLNALGNSDAASSEAGREVSPDPLCDNTINNQPSDTSQNEGMIRHNNSYNPAPLPDEAQRDANRAELKETLMALFWDFA